MEEFFKTVQMMPNCAKHDSFAKYLTQCVYLFPAFYFVSSEKVSFAW